MKLPKFEFSIHALYYWRASGYSMFSDVSDVYKSTKSCNIAASWRVATTGSCYVTASRHGLRTL